MKNGILYTLIILLTVASGAAVLNYNKAKQQSKIIETLTDQVSKITEYSQILANELKEARKVKTYQISLAPNVNTKVATTFGSAKEITIQYYFTMDGNKIELVPDSTVYLKK